ncbi:MAG: hypothetical protein ACFFG0_29935 [Candidatus Thorarchaeota archaeon]
MGGRSLGEALIPILKGGSVIHKLIDLSGNNCNLLSETKLEKWRQWKNSGKDVRTDFVDVKWGRERLFERTGVKVYPMTKNIKIELIDDPHYEKRFPRASRTQIEKWHSK